MPPTQLSDIYAETLAVFDRQATRYEPLTTPEVAEALGANRRTVYKRLRTLVDRGELETKSTGSNSRVWWRPPSDSVDRSDDAQPRLAAMEASVDGIAIIDETKTFTYVNQSHAEIYGYDHPEQLVGETCETCYGPDERSRFAEEIMPTLDETGVWRGEAIGQRADGSTFPQELSLSLTDDGRIICIVRDITDRKEREAELRASQQFNEELVEHAPFGMLRIDEEFRITYENPRAEEIIGLPDDAETSAAIGVDIRALPSTADIADEDVFTPLQDGETIEFEFPFESIYGNEVHFVGRGVPVERDGEFAGAVLMATDISDRKEREEELRASQRFNEELVEHAPFAMFRLDEELRISYENPRAEEIIGVPEGTETPAGIGVDIREIPPVIETGKAELFSRLQDGETIEFEFPFESVYGKESYFSGRGVPLYRDGEFDGAVLMATDISDRKQREEELRASQQFNEELVEHAPFGIFRLDEELRTTYENPRAKEIIGLPDDAETSVGIGVDIRELPSIIQTGEAELFSRLQDGETIEFEFPFESIYGKEAYFTGRSVPLYRDGEFDGAVLMANDISERRQRERDLERQREQLAALNELHDVVGEITAAVIEQSTRTEIEQTVCDRLADTDSYRFARVYATDSGRHPEPRVDAGVDDLADVVSPSVDEAGQPSDGPLGTAVRTEAVDVARQILQESPAEPWQQLAHDHGFRSTAAIPISHQGVCYGVLSVWSERPDAFAEAEREVMAQLGEVIGHTIAAVKRKRALMSTEAIELELSIPALLSSPSIPQPTDGTVTVDRTVPLGDGDYLLYGTAPADAADLLAAVGERLPGWETMETITTTDDELQFEQRLSDPPLTSTVADHGGSVDSGRIDDRTYSLTIHLPPGTNTGTVLSELRETYPSLELVSQRQVVREEPSTQRLRSGFTETLTERQRAALEAGYYGGFFDFPRDRSGHDVAAALDIGTSTFHQHVRKAEKKLLDVVFGDR